MPAFYAHHQFGEQVFTLLNEELQQLIYAHTKEFLIGLQGPDVFFFYHPWKSNDVIDYGNHLHEVPASWMFQRGMTNGRNTASYAYMLGVVCHFALDSRCHPYVAEYEKIHGISHIEIESEFEKMLLRKSGKNPFTFSTAQLIPTDYETAKTIYNFYNVYDAEKMQFALRWMRNFKQIFTESSVWRQKVLNMVLTLSGFGKYKWQILQHKDNPNCTVSNENLYQIYQDTLEHAVTLIYELDFCKQTGTSLSEKWDITLA